MQSAYAFLLSLSLATVLIPPLIRAAVILGMTDAGGGRRVHEGVTPRTGGIAIVVGALVSTLLLLPPRQDTGAFVAAAGLLFVFGVLDDRFNLDYRLKTLGQLVAALVVTLFGGIVVSRLPLLQGAALPAILAIPFTVFALIAVTNAINLSDGLDGLAGGISVIAVGSLVLLAYLAGDLATATLGLAVIGATFGFLRFNTHPALLFMGDTGSQFLGFAAGVLAVVVTQFSDPELSPAVPLLLLGLPVLDTLTVMVGRLSRGQSPFKADRTHLHHRLLAAGLNQTEAVALIYGAQFLLAALGYLLRYSDDWLVLTVYAGLSVILLAAIRWFERHRARLLNRDKGAGPVMLLTGRLIASRMLTRGPLAALNILVPLVLVLPPLLVPDVPGDVAVLAAALLVALLIALAVPGRHLVAMERLGAYVIAVTAVYLLNRGDWLWDVCTPCGYALFGGLVLAVAIWLRFSSQRFRINAQDILILLIAGAISTLPDLGFHQLGLVTLQTLILFYSIEVLMDERARSWDPLRIGVMLAMGAIIAKGLMA